MLNDKVKLELFSNSNISREFPTNFEQGKFELICVESNINMGAYQCKLLVHPRLENTSE
jgi:hypothetical protein